jgi:hypothetical protein
MIDEDDIIPRSRGETDLGRLRRVAIIDAGIERSHPAFSHMSPDAIMEADFTKKPGGDHGCAPDSDGRAATICGGIVESLLSPSMRARFAALPVM